MKGIEKREKIFNAYSANLQYVANKYKIEIGIGTDNGPQPIDCPIYICPLCMRGFSIEAIDHTQENHLTIEDLPPRSVGGNPKILTCKSCNNTSGHSLDKLILDSLITESFIKRIPNSSIKSTLSINDGSRYNITTQIDDNKGLRFILKTENNPIAKKDLDYMVGHWKDSTINFTFQGPNKKKVATSLVRIGLLLTFYYLGNRVLFEGNYHKIRNHVIDPKENKLPHDGIIIIPPEKNIQTGIHLIKEPEKYRSYIIIFNITIDTLSKTVAFPFPGPTEHGWNKYCNLKELKKDTNFKLTDVTSKKYVDDEYFANAYDYLYYKI